MLANDLRAGVLVDQLPKLLEPLGAGCVTQAEAESLARDILSCLASSPEPCFRFVTESSPGASNLELRTFGSLGAADEERMALAREGRRSSAVLQMVDTPVFSGGALVALFDEMSGRTMVPPDDGFRSYGVYFDGGVWVSDGLSDAVITRSRIRNSGLGSARIFSLPLGLSLSDHESTIKAVGRLSEGVWNSPIKNLDGAVEQLGFRRGSSLFFVTVEVHSGRGLGLPDIIEVAVAARNESEALTHAESVARCHGAARGCFYLASGCSRLA